MPEAAPVIEVIALTRDFAAGGTVVHALRAVDFRVDVGEMVAIMGPSGSGKSTLLNLLGCLDRPTGGSYRLDGEAVEKKSDDDLADVRNARIGFVFQSFNLLPRTSALDNVVLPLLYDRRRRKLDAWGMARSALARVDLTDRQHHEPNQLSGGQQQRVAIARALVTEPALILADEPTGNLDTHTTLEVMTLFQELNDQGVTLVIITHEQDVAAYCKRRIVLRDGRIVEDEHQEPRRAADDLAAMPAEAAP